MMPTTSPGEMPRIEMKSLFKLGGAAAVLALATNLLDVALGFGGGEAVAYGGRSAVEWFSLFQINWFQGLYVLGILNIVYQVCLIPVYAAMIAAHRGKYRAYAALAMILFGLGMAVYMANNAAIPMHALSGKFAAAGTEAQRALYAAAGETILARGEDFTPGSFIGLILGGLAALAMSFVMLRGGVFKKATAWIGIVGFSLLTVFTVLATFVPSLLSDRVLRLRHARRVGGAGLVRPGGPQAVRAGQGANTPP